MNNLISSGQVFAAETTLFDPVLAEGRSYTHVHWLVPVFDVIGAHARGIHSCWLKCNSRSYSRPEELSAALQLHQQAAAVKLDRTQQAAAVKLGGSPQQAEGEGCQSAQAVAEASLKLALLCNDLLQVWQSSVVTVLPMLSATAYYSLAKIAG